MLLPACDLVVSRRAVSPAYFFVDIMAPQLRSFTSQITLTVPYKVKWGLPNFFPLPNFSWPNFGSGSLKKVGQPPAPGWHHSSRPQNLACLPEGSPGLAHHARLFSMKPTAHLPSTHSFVLTT